MRTLEEQHSVYSIMMTIDNGIGIPTPWETKEQYERRVADATRAAESIHRHHIQPLIDRVRRLERERLESKRDNRIDVEWYP